jgi:hypothetical protein
VAEVSRACAWRTRRAYDDVVSEPFSSPVLELLDWVARDKRSYAETMAAWTTHCPRLTTWEDALAAGLVEVVRDGTRGSKVALTRAGSAALNGVRAA